MSDTKLSEGVFAHAEVNKYLAFGVVAIVIVGAGVYVYSIKKADRAARDASAQLKEGAVDLVGSQASNLPKTAENVGSAAVGVVVGAGKEALHGVGTIFDAVKNWWNS